MWYNRTEVATKTELEDVKGLIDVSARLVGVYSLNGMPSFLIPGDFDYIKIIFTYFIDTSDAGQITQDPTRYLIPGGECVTHGSCSIDSGNNYKLTTVRVILNNHTLSFYSFAQYTSELSAEARVEYVTIEAYKYQ